MPAQAGTVQLSHLEQTIYFAAQRQGVNILDADTVTCMVGTSRSHAINLLASMARKSALYRLGRGRYVVIPPTVLYERKGYVIDPQLILDELIKADDPDGRYYVAYQSAAAIHGAAHQLPFVLLVATPKQRRPVVLGQARIQFVQLKLARFFGFEVTRYQEASLNVSDPEKTLLDCLERFDLCGGVAEVARTISVLIEGAKSSTLSDYMMRMDNQALIQRLGLILERLGTVQMIDEHLIANIAGLVGNHTYPLDPHGPAAGRVDARWHIRENIDVLEEL